ncbi:SecD export membrane protein [Desulfovibrio sp. X2]|uniref:protein translocase subunit SecD n=1 Tax=Desulfovibrio sp. X2 TaxID=941449 RepID=UPI000358EC10|nr:protein translocase subunit SecD [Desulfovibrio sp. X2]EPR42249.1 SecD export membrane protein [Desulfovibrio sp. X2]
MKLSLGLRIGLIAVVTLLGLAYMLPSFPAVRNSPLGKILPSDQINLGLDLKGGIHLTLEADVDTALDNQLAQMGSEVRDESRDDKIAVLRPEVLPGHKLTFSLLRADQRTDLDELLSKKFPNLVVTDRKPGPDGRIDYVANFKPSYVKYLAGMTVDQAVKTIRNRIDQFGVAEPDIRKQEGNRIQVQLPGLNDPERAIAIIRQTAHLEFRLVDDSVDIQKAEKGILPPGREVMMMRTKNPDGTYMERPIVVHSEAALTGQSIVDAGTAFDTWNQPYVTMTFDARGAKLFERVTGENVGKRLAIVLDGKVYSAPVIQDRISGGRAQITGSFSVDQAHDLALVLRAGALPAPVKVLEQRTVGPSLGQESIDAGVNAAIIGFAAVVLFMAVYYGLSGIIADAVLILNIVLILAGLALFGATLTLPGIAGIILTIGMAVDANVLIYERIREDLRKGLTPRAAIAEGYNRATITIMDANLTTVFAGIVLYQFGTGPIRGFAVTLILGIVASMFTAIFVSHVLFDLMTERSPAPAKLSI